MSNSEEITTAILLAYGASAFLATLLLIAAVYVIMGCVRRWRGKT